ncbi:MAG: hypothetical protein IIA89_12295 [Chloroflexi bacterium]|nr:hypothetical protein [Chloroflexota bacterium]
MINRNNLAFTLASVVCLGVLLVACSGSADPAAQPPPPSEVATTLPAPTAAASGVEGRVWIGPTCPVARAGTECPDQPYEAQLTVTDVEANVVARGMADEEGFFRLQLPAGDYILVPETPNPRLPPFASPIPFIVNSGRFTQLTVNYDSGIR